MAKTKGFTSVLAGVNSKTVISVEQTIKELPLEESNRGSYCTAILPDKDFISFNFDLTRDIASSEGMDDSVEIKMYQDAGLNPLLEYNIVYNYTNSKIDSSMVNVQAFAISLNSLKTQLEPYTKRFGYIDVTVPSETLPYALYNSNTLDPQNDIFIYFEKDILLISIFSDGEFIYSKEADFGLKKLVDNFTAMTGEQIKYDDFIEILISKGVDESLHNEESQRFLIDFAEMFTNIFTQVGSVIQYAGRMFGIDEFDRVFIGTEKGTIPNILPFSRDMLGIEGHDYLFFTDFFLKNDKYIDQRYVLSLLELQNSTSKKNKNPFNATIYKRPSSYLKRPGGRLIIISLIAFILSFSYPLFMLLESTKNEVVINSKLKELKFSKAEFADFKAKEDSILKRKNKLTEKLQREKAKYKTKRELLEKIYEKKIVKKAKVDFINDIFIEINKKKVKINNFQLQENFANINLESKAQGRITSLVKKLVAEKYRVQMQNVTYSEELKRYTASLKVFVK